MLVDYDEVDITVLFKDGLEKYGRYDVKIYGNPYEALDNINSDLLIKIFK